MVPFSRAPLWIRSETVASRCLVAEAPCPSSTFLQNQVDGMVSRFVEEAADPKTLVSLTVGGVAYGWGKIGVMGLGAAGNGRIPLQLASIGVGLVSEVTAFEWTNRTLQTFRTINPSPDLWSWSGPGGWKQSLLGDLISFGILKGASSLTRESNLALQHTFASTAMVASQNLASNFGILPKPEGSVAEQLLHAERLNLQMEAGMGLVSALAPRLYFSERAFDLSLRASMDTSLPFFLSQGPRLHYVTEGFREESLSPTEPHRKDIQELIQYPMASLGGGGGEGAETEADRVLQREKLSRTFHDPLKKIFTHEIAISEILDAVMEIPSRLKFARTHFLAALTHSRLHDPADAYLMILTVREVFRRNPLYSSMGSYSEALIQLFVESALTDPDPGRTGFALRGLYETLKKGGTPSLMEELLESYGYAEQEHLNREERDEAREGLLEEFSAFEPKIYTREGFLGALDFAENSRFPRVAFRRLASILKNQDHPAKILELTEQPPYDQGKGLYERFRKKPFYEVVRDIRKGYHTAFLDDPRLAHKAVSIAQTEYEYRVKDPNRIPHHRFALEKKVEAFMKGWQRLMPDELVEFLGCNGGELAKQVAREWGKRSFDILILPSKEYEEKVKGLGEDFKGGLVSLEEKGDAPPQFVVRDLSYEDRSTPEQYQKAFLGLISRLSNFVQKWELMQQLHYEKFFEILGGEMENPPHPTHSRLILRMLSTLEEQRWLLINGLSLEWDLADRVGGMVKHLRGWVEYLLSRSNSLSSPSPSDQNVP